MRRRWKPIVAIGVVVVLLAVGVRACRDDDDATDGGDPPASSSVPVEDLPSAEAVVAALRTMPCQLADPEKVALALDVETAEATKASDGVCAVEAGEVTIRVEVRGPVAPSAFGAGLTDLRDLAEGPDRVSTAGSAEGPTVVVLRGGVEARATFTSTTLPDDVDAFSGRLGSLLVAAIPSNRPVADPAGSETDACALVETADPSQLGLGTPSVTPSGPTCSLTFPDRQLVATLTISSTEADATSLEGLDRTSSNPDGEAVTWPQERFDLPGEGAVWLLDPTTSDLSSGDLYVLDGSTLYLLTVSLGPKDDAAALDLARRLALLVVVAAG